MIAFAYLEITLDGPCFASHDSFFFDSKAITCRILSLKHYRLYRKKKREIYVLVVVSCIDYGIHAQYKHDTFKSEISYLPFYTHNACLCACVHWNFLLFIMPKAWKQIGDLIGASQVLKLISFSFIIYNVQSESVNKGRMKMKYIDTKLRDSEIESEWVRKNYKHTNTSKKRV